MFKTRRRKRAEAFEREMIRLMNSPLIKEPTLGERIRDAIATPFVVVSSPPFWIVLGAVWVLWMLAR